ncbi:TRAP transporter substrate-binding protein [Thiomicrospira cyclica]|uniref:Extracellular solute-binding protein, family 7 n=1 Tax=Thiomicrospira cyclica (strain DSM 14477 / JCM 11371 / ALM1) TaxID=717773 RepID=F6DA87_THICA|nr:TRAP transporter substrate-binding protein [Thiomicrospira cyclica]AEG32218.1 Extracellular solute-binding protein, family 7 [Thiomicrospira cyclica ALM1]
MTQQRKAPSVQPIEAINTKTTSALGRRALLTGAVAVTALGLSGCQSEADGVVIDRERVFHWKMVTAWPKNFPGLGTGANELAQLIEQMSGGRIKITVFGAGELVGPFEVFDAVSQGQADLGHATAYYWKGKLPSADFFTVVPMGLTAEEMNSWLYYGGGMALWEEAYKPFGLIPNAAGNTGTQMGGWFNREITSIADLRGLKIRMPGLGAEVYEKVGAVTVNLPGNELFQGMQTGLIDAVEFVGPYNDLAFGFHRVAKYYYTPGWQEPGSALECMINEKAFAELTPDLQVIVRSAMKVANLNMLAEYTARNQQALNTLVNQHGVQLRHFPQDVLLALKKTSAEVVEAAAARDPLAQKVWASQKAFRDQVAPWTEQSLKAFLDLRYL